MPRLANQISNFRPARNTRGRPASVGQNVYPPRLLPFLHPMIRFFATAACVFSLCVSLCAAESAQSENASEVFERRIGGRADKILERLALSDAARAEHVRAVVLKFYRELHAAHASRDEQLAAVTAGEAHAIGRIYFHADKQSHHVYGEFVGTLARELNQSQIDAIKDWMTFDLLRLSVEEYDRMFPRLSEPQREQLRLWLVESREAAIIAGSAETKLDVFRVNKLRMHAYLVAQGFDVETAVKAEAARKAALK